MSLLNVDELRKNIDELNSRLNEVNAKIESIYKEINEYKQKLDGKRRELSSVIEQLNKKRGELSSIKSTINDLVKRKNELIESMKAAKAEKDEVGKRIIQLRDRLRNLRGILREIEATEGKVEDKDKLRVMISKLEFSHETSPSDPKKEAEYFRLISELEKNLEKAETLDKVRSYINNLEREIENLRNRRIELANRLKETYENEYKPIKDKITELKNMANKVRGEIGELKKKRDQLKAERDELKKTILSKYAEVKQLKETRRQIIDEIRKNELLLTAALKSMRIVEAKMRREELRKRALEKVNEAMDRLKKGERISLNEFGGLDIDEGE